MGLTATGVLAPIEVRKAYEDRKTHEMIVPRACFVYSTGREADQFDVGREIDDEHLESLVGERVVCEVRQSVRWPEGDNKAGGPVMRLTVTDIRRADVA